jgi:hypothetical protein
VVQGTKFSTALWLALWLVLWPHSGWHSGPRHESVVVHGTNQLLSTAQAVSLSLSKGHNAHPGVECLSDDMMMYDVMLGVDDMCVWMMCVCRLVIDHVIDHVMMIAK